MTVEENDPLSFLDLKINIQDISNVEKEVSLTLDDKATQSLCKLLDILDFSLNKCVFHISPLTGGCFKVQTKLDYLITQKCVISLEDIQSKIKEEVETEFWPKSKLTKYYDEASEQDLSADIEDDKDFEEIESDIIDLGKYFYEILSTSIDPYPKKDGAELDWKNSSEEAADLSNKPFASLKVLKNGADK